MEKVVLGGGAPVKRKGEDEVQSSKQPKKEKIKAYEYDKWDKFDVDEALEKVDDCDEPAKDKDVRVDPAALLSQAVAEKDRGNGHFKAGRYDEAIDCYTRGIKCDPKSAVLVANRAMALLKKGRYEAANADATLAISLDPSYTKAYLRRGTARRELGDFPGAMCDFEKAVELDPKNQQAKDELEKTMVLEAEKAKGPVEKAEKTEQGQDFAGNLKAAFTKKSTKKSVRLSPKAAPKLAPGQILSIQKAPHERSKKPLRRIEIIEVGGDNAEDETSTAGPVPVRNSEPESMDVAVTSPLPTSVNAEQEISDKLEAAVTLDEGKKRADKLKKPKTAIQFETTWRRLSDVEREGYLQLLTEKDYPVIFKHTLEPTTFEGVVAVLSRMDSSVAIRHLVGLSRVPRMSALVMFMEDGERAAIKKILESTSATNQIDPRVLRATTKAFQV